MNDGDAAAAEDTWLRVVVNSTHVRPLMQGANRKRLIRSAILKQMKPPIQERPWKKEMSGRLLSLANDLVADGIGRRDSQRQRLMAKDPGMAAKIELIGFAAAIVRQIRCCADPDHPEFLDVYKTSAPDPAHADLVVKKDADEKQLYFLADKLQDCLLIVPPEQINDLEQCRILAT